MAEIVDGTLYTHPRPAAPHARAKSSLDVKIGGPFDNDAGGPGEWWIVLEPELHLSEDILVPDWVCEVLSPSTRTANARSTPAKEVARR